MAYKAAYLIDGRLVTGIDHPAATRTTWRPGIVNRVKPPTKLCVGLNDCERIIDCWHYLPHASALMEVESGGVTVTGLFGKATHEHSVVLRAWVVANLWSDVRAAGFGELADAGDACLRAKDACDRAWDAYVRARDDYARAWDDYRRTLAATDPDALQAALVAVICTPGRELRWTGERWEL